MKYLYMPSGEYQSLMKELGYTSSSTNPNNAGSRRPPNNGTNTTDQSLDVMLGQLTLRLDDKWERFAANVAVQTLNLGREVVDCCKIVAYSVSACLLLYGVAAVLRALPKRLPSPPRENEKNDPANDQE